jgi:hypothetical protein
LSKIFTGTPSSKKCGTEFATAAAGVLIVILHKTLTSGVVVAICEVELLDNSQDPAAAWFTQKYARATFPDTGIAIVAVAVPPAILVTIDLLYAILPIMA